MESNTATEENKQIQQSENFNPNLTIKEENKKEKPTKKNNTDDDSDSGDDSLDEA